MNALGVQTLLDKIENGDLKTMAELQLHLKNLVQKPSGEKTEKQINMVHECKCLLKDLADEATKMINMCDNAIVQLENGDAEEAYSTTQQLISLVNNGLFATTEGLFMQVSDGKDVEQFEKLKLC